MERNLLIHQVYEQLNGAGLEWPGTTNGNLLLDYQYLPYHVLLDCEVCVLNVPLGQFLLARGNFVVGNSSITVNITSSTISGNE